MNKKLFLLELNEFNLNLLTECSQIYSLKNVQKILQFYKTETISSDDERSEYLEPWVQWVSVHTGVSSKEHSIKHLGDVPELDFPQIWQKLGDLGYNSLVWGAMNASRNGCENCLAFLPDPWTFSEKAFPEELNALLKPLRFFAKNYLKQSKWEIFCQVLNLLKFMKKKGMLTEFFVQLTTALKLFIKFEGEHFPLIALLELFSVKLFLKYKKDLNPDFSILFVNTLAHIQHHHWKDQDYANNKRLAFGLAIIDQILGLIFENLQEEETFLIANALSQKNTNQETPWILYRQFQHEKFLDLLKIKYVKVEPHMTHDAHLFFANKNERDLAEKILNRVTIQNKKLFSVENYANDENKLFYKIIFTDAVPQNCSVDIGGFTDSFFKYFKKVVQRTGRHIPKGVLFSSEDLFEKQMPNHQVFQSILQTFQR